MKLYSIQYLRAAAALMVVLTHAMLHPLTTRAPVVVRVGGVGVTLFFVISGFIMILISGAAPFDRAKFYLRRIQRVVPLYWTATAALAIVAVVAPSVLKTTRFSWGDLIQSLLFIPHYRTNGELVPMLKLGWTLNLEMFFYFWFGVFAFLPLLRRTGVLTLLLCGFALAGQLIAFSNPILISFASIHMASFCVGMWLGVARLRGDAAIRSPAACALLAGGGVALLLFSLFVPGEYPAPHIVLSAAFGSAALLWAGIHAEGALLRSRLATLLGDASYSIYLVHMYFVAATITVARRFVPNLPYWELVAIAFLCGTVGGVAVHFAVERPFMRLFARKRPAPARPRGGALPDGVPPALVSEATTAPPAA